MPDISFQVSIPIVPTQAPGSNDCGIFVICFIERIVMAPLEFVERAQINQLEDWFLIDPQQKRQQLAAEILRLANEQHAEGGVLSGKKLVNLPDLYQSKEFNNYWKDNLLASLPPSLSVLSPQAFGLNPRDNKKVSQSYKGEKSKRLCGLCREPGHTRAKCHMKMS